MVYISKHNHALILRLIVGLALLGWPRVGSAQGMWSVISLPQKAGQVRYPGPLTVDGAGNLYVADKDGGNPRLQMRDTHGSWSVIATSGAAVGQVGSPSALAANAAGTLYVADYTNAWRIQRRDPGGNWSVIATADTSPGQLDGLAALAVDASDNLYLAAQTNDGGQIQKRDAQSHWSLITLGSQVLFPRALAVDPAGDLYVADQDAAGHGRIQRRDVRGNWTLLAVEGATALAVDGAGNLYAMSDRLRKRDAQGNWSVLAAVGSALGQVSIPTGLAAGRAGNVYVADQPDRDRIQQRDAQGNWSVIATTGSAPGQLSFPSAVAVDGAGNLYVVAGPPLVSGEGEIQKRDAQGNWSVIGPVGTSSGQVTKHSALAVDAAGNLYVAEEGSGGTVSGWIQERDAQGHWSILATAGNAPGQVNAPIALAADAAGNLYVAERYQYDAATNTYPGRIQKRDAQGNWSVLASKASTPGRVDYPTALAVDAVGNLYVADGFSSIESDGYEIQERDAQGHWSLIATGAGDLGPYVENLDAGLAVDSAGNLYLADSVYFGQIQRRDARGSWSVIATRGSALGQVRSPYGVAADAAIRLYIADTGNDRVQLYMPQP